MKNLVFALVALAPLSGHAAHLKCTQVGGDKDDSRLSRKIDLTINETEASIRGEIFGHESTDSGQRDGKDSGGQAVYSGFSTVKDDNYDLRAYADLSLLAGKPGRFSFWLKGDGEDSVDGRYDFYCK